MITTEVNGNGTKNGNGALLVNAPDPTTAIAPLSQSDCDELMQMITQMREKLPFLQDITAESRRTMAGMGDSNRAFAGKVLEVVSQNDDFLPRSFNVEQLRADLATFDRLSSLAMSMTQLCNLMDATAIAIGTQAYEQSLMAYRHAKVSGRGASLDGMMAKMSQRFAKKTKKKEETQPEEASAEETQPGTV